MIILTEEKLKKLEEIEGWFDEEFEEFKNLWSDDPIYVWGGRDEKEVYELLEKEGYKWKDGDGDQELKDFDPGWTFGYPVIIFRHKGNVISYTPVDFGRDTDEEPKLD